MAEVTWALDPRAKRISVYYTETSSTIYEGMPVCYAFDTTDNWTGYGPATDGAAATEQGTTAEGEHNEGKFIYVEDPDADNIHAFAGVVAGSSKVGQLGGQLIDIYIPNGAIVPVRTDQSCTVGRTILCVHTAEQHLTGPYETAGRPVAVAWETDTAPASAAALVLAKLDPNLFIYQKADATNLLVDDQDTGNTLFLNQIKVDFASATGNCTALSVQATSSAGAASNGYGSALYVQGDLTATPSSHWNPFGCWANITGGTPASIITVGEFGLYVDGATMSSVSKVSVLTLRFQFVDDAAANGNLSIFRIVDDDSYDPCDALISAYELSAIGGVVSTGDAPAPAAGDIMIPVVIETGTGAGTYYLCALADTGV